MITLEAAAKLLLEKDNILILTHRFPDGDTLGSGYALCMALQQLGKKACVECSDIIPNKYSFFTEKVRDDSFEEEFVVSVDIADTKLLGDKLSHYADKVDLCIDHHGSNTQYAKDFYVEAKAASATQIIAKLLGYMNVEITKDIANAVFTGLSTDTGCFRYTNATSETFRTAADMIDCGAESGMINRVMFDTKSRARLEIERRVLDTIEFFADGRCAVVYSTVDMIKAANASNSDMEGIAAMTRQIEGVAAGITLREQPGEKFKVSVRTIDGLDASSICAEFGGGGHKAAAGCVINGSLAEVKSRIVEAACKAIEEQI